MAGPERETKYLSNSPLNKSIVTRGMWHVPTCHASQNSFILSKKSWISSHCNGSNKLTIKWMKSAVNFLKRVGILLIKFNDLQNLFICKTIHGYIIDQTEDVSCLNQCCQKDNS